MTNQIANALFDPTFILVILVSVAIFGTVFTVVPIFGRSQMNQRMKSVALERESLKKKERRRMEIEGQKKAGLRHQDEGGVKGLVEKLDLKRFLADDKTQKKLLIAGMRGPKPMTTFLFARFLTPMILFALALAYVFGAGAMVEQPFFLRFFAAFLFGYMGFYLPAIYVSNIANKRKAVIKRAWPDALDLLLICVESGMSIEASFRRVAEEIGIQSVELAEELVLTTAELSYLSERRQAYTNLAERTGLESVKDVAQALIQAERYGTPIAHALRVLSNESREQRMTEAEKKAAALPPKLTVPMILFFLPVLFAVILTPACMSIMAQGGIFGS